jgi:hypothetical protein
MLFNPRIMVEVCVQEQYFENIGQKKGKLSGLKQKECQEYSKKGKKKWKGGKYQKRESTAHQSKYSNNN